MTISIHPNPTADYTSLAFPTEILGAHQRELWAEKQVVEFSPEVAAEALSFEQWKELDQATEPDVLRYHLEERNSRYVKVIRKGTRRENRRPEDCGPDVERVYDVLAQSHLVDAVQDAMKFRGYSLNLIQAQHYPTGALIPEHDHSEKKFQFPYVISLHLTDPSEYLGGELYVAPSLKDPHLTPYVQRPPKFSISIMPSDALHGRSLVLDGAVKSLAVGLAPKF